MYLRNCYSKPKSSRDEYVNPKNPPINLSMVTAEIWDRKLTNYIGIRIYGDVWLWCLWRLSCQSWASYGDTRAVKVLFFFVIQTQLFSKQTLIEISSAGQNNIAQKAPKVRKQLTAQVWQAPEWDQILPKLLACHGWSYMYFGQRTRAKGFQLNAM